MTNAAEDYLAAALAIMEEHAMHRDRIDWHALRLASAQHAVGAFTPADTYDTIRWALTRLEDRHSFFAPPDRGDDAIASGKFAQEVTVPHGHLRTDRIAYLNIPAFRGTLRDGTRYADDLQILIAKMDTRDPVGWMVDLTENSGGNMWPMLAGLGPLLGEGPLGSFTFPHDSPAIWSYRAGHACLDGVSLAKTGDDGYRLRWPSPPVALLMTMRTASSGEAVVIAFADRPNTCRFGTATRGLTTANEGFPLPDGATIMVTVSTFVDRRGRVYGQAIEPDQYVDGEGEQIQTRAATWIHATAQARATPPQISSSGR